jgi:hypothetical protein
VIAQDGLLHILFSPVQPDRAYYLEYTTALYPADWTRAGNAFQIVLPSFDGGFVTARPTDQQVIYRIVADIPVFGPEPMPAAVHAERM